MLLFDYFFDKNYFFNLNFALSVLFMWFHLLRILLHFLQKLTKLHRNFVCIYENIHNCVWYFWRCAEPIFKGYGSWQGKKQPLGKKDICKKRYSQNFMINIRKYCKKSNIYNSLKKHIFKQLKKAINQTLNISFQNTLEDTAFLY